MTSLQIKHPYWLASAIWGLGLPILIAINFGIRTFLSESRYTLGMPEGVWFGLQILLAALAIYPLSLHLRDMRSWKVLLQIVMMFAGGFAYFILITGFYIISTGVDSL